MRPRLALLLVALLAVAPPAQAETEVPGALMQEVLIKTSLLTLNDANITGNYTVLYAKLAQPFRKRFTPEQLRDSFEPFAKARLDYGMIAAKRPVPTAAAVIDRRGALILRGYFDTWPSRLSYELDFVRSEGEWKPIKLNVDIKPVEGSYVDNRPVDRN